MLGMAAGQTAKAPVKKPAAKSKTSASKKKKTRTPAAQMRPTPERYKQIEQVLLARGYLKEEPTGKWSPGAVEALKSFQADHNLPVTGRLDSVSLIELGLGPRHERIPAER